MYNLEDIQNDVKNILSEKRYIHSVGVMKQAEYLARKYNEDIQIAKTVGIVHDIAKEMSREEKLEYANKNNIYVDDIEKVSVGLLHAKIGADICKRKYNFTEQMQDAIKYHTTGNIRMDKLAKIIYIADKTEENRKYDDLQTVQKLADEDLDKCILYILDYMLVDNVKKQKTIHPDSIKIRNKILLENLKYKS